jgi:hypothetical protein
LYSQVLEVTKYEFREVTYGLMPIQNFIKVLLRHQVIKCVQTDITCGGYVGSG